MRPVNLPPIIIHTGRPISPGLPTDPAESASVRTWPGFELSNGPLTSTIVSRQNSIVTLDTTTSGAWRIHHGSLVAFALNVDELADHYHPGDAEARETLRSFRLRHYVVLVSDSYVDPETKSEVLLVNFVSNAPPDAVDAKDQYIPLGGNKAYLDRPFLKLPPNMYLPWPNCVVWTSFGTHLKVSALHESSLRFAIDDDSYTMIEQRIVEDLAELKLKPHFLDPEKMQEVQALVLPDVPHSAHYNVEPLPATIWRDARAARECGNPFLLLEEIHRLEDEMLHINDGRDEALE